MTKRENVLSLYKRQGYEKAPVEFSLCPSLVDEYIKQTNDKECKIEEYFDFDIRNVAPLKINRQSDDIYMKYYNTDLNEGTSIDDYGVAHEPGSDKSVHFTLMHHPAERLTSLDELKAYPFGDVDLQCEAQQAEDVKKIHSRGYAACGGYEATIWERSWYFRSMPELMCDMMTDDEKATYILDKFTQDAIIQCNSFARSGVDILRVGDDIGMQSNILMSEELYVKWIKPRMRKVIIEAKKINPDLLVQYHSCGYIVPFIDHLIEIGVDILNPVQPESMDFEEIHNKYKDVLSFNGTMGTQTTMPFSTPEEVYEKVQYNLDIAGNKGGLLCAPTHVLEPEVPWENILAYVKACRDYCPKK